MQDNTQLAHDGHRPSDKKFPLSIIANDITSSLNVGSLFRLCDALAIERLYLCGDTPVPPNSKISKTSRSTEKYVDYETHKNAEALASSLQDSGSNIIALEITSSSIAIGSDKFKALFTRNKPVCLIIGAENSGVNEILLALSDASIHIPMLGNNSSMNVVTATAIACFEISRNLT